MRILFLGAGGTGGYFGGRAAEAGLNVTFLLRPARAESVRAQGLRIKSLKGEVSVSRPKVVTADAPGGPYDLAVLSCKAYDLDAAIESLRPAAGADTAILPILNGIRQYDTLDAAFGAGRVLGGLCQIGATLGPDGEVRHLALSPAIIFGERAGGGSARCEAISQAFAPVTAYAMKASGDIYQDIWEKYTFLATLAAATCLMRGTVGEINRAEGGEGFLRALLAECNAIARGHGHAMRPEHEARALGNLISRESTGTSSMFRDLSQGGRVEADHIVGEMVRRAGKLGLDAPCLRAAWTHLQVYETQRAARGA
jgi:2-dehydropantoate 2-reductase